MSYFHNVVTLGSGQSHERPWNACLHEGHGKSRCLPTWQLQPSTIPRPKPLPPSMRVQYALFCCKTSRALQKGCTLLLCVMLLSCVRLLAGLNRLSFKHTVLQPATSFQTWQCLNLKTVDMQASCLLDYWARHQSEGRLVIQYRLCHTALEGTQRYDQAVAHS